MTRDETKSILDIIIRAYPRMKIVETKEDVDLWNECLSDLVFDNARKAAISLVKQTKDFPPDIATIREEYGKLIEEVNAKDRAVRDLYRNITRVYTGADSLDKYLSIFRERCGNDPAVAVRLRNALERFADTKYQWLPNLGQAIECIDIDTQTIPDEMMELVQEYKAEPLPDISKWSFKRPSRLTDERK